MSADEYIARIDAIIDRYGKAIENNTNEADRATFYQSAMDDLASLSPKVNSGDAARWLRVKGWPR